MIEFRLLLLVLAVQAKLVISVAQCDNDVCTNEILMKFEPTWDSLDKRPLPRWYDDAKVGIFIHWGVYSVPSFGTEWFWTNWQGQKEPSYVDFMTKNYKPGFTYQDFANDFTAELFNATEWALLFRDSGAKYVVLTSKHHDGYCLWPSMHSFSWNSQDVGPKRDIIGELSSSIRANTDIKFGLYYSLFEWFNRMYLDDKFYLFTRTNYVDMKMWPELIELVTKYKPEVVWTDGDWESFYTYWKSTKFLAWLYNESPVKETVVTNDRWGIGTTCHHGDFFTCSDRYNPGVLQKHKWENALTIDKGSWGHRSNIKLQDYMSSEELIEQLVSTVSCGGNILVNVGPTKYGTIEPIFEERLRDMGQWLKNNGEAIYSSKPWKYQNDTVTKNLWFTSKNSEDGSSVYVYATILNYPLDSWFKLHVFDRTSTIKSVELLGLPNEEIKWKLQTNALAINVPPKHILDMHGLKLAWSFKITISDDKNLNSLQINAL